MMKILKNKRGMSLFGFMIILVILFIILYNFMPEQADMVKSMLLNGLDKGITKLSGVNFTK